jgi:hypothetical protein
MTTTTTTAALPADLEALLTEETAGRARSMLASRRKAAGFPTGKTFEVWDPGASSIPSPTQQALQTLEWVQRRENLVVCGPAGTGKTFFLEALGQKVIEAGMPVAWFTLEQIGVQVRAHRADDPLGNAVAKIVRAELVVVDDVGLLPVGADAAEGLYRIVEAAYERKSVAISSNLHPSWVRRAHAQNVGHRHRRPAAAPRTPLPNQRRLRATSPSPPRERSQTPGLTPTPTGGRHTLMGRFMSATGPFLLATNGQFPRPPTGSYQCPLTAFACAVLGPHDLYRDGVRCGRAVSCGFCLPLVRICALGVGP